MTGHPADTRIEALREMRDHLAVMEGRDLLGLNREGQRSLLGVLTDALAALDAAAADLAELRQALADETTRHHCLRWTLGLETHEGEEPQTLEQSLANLRALSRGDTP